MPLDNAAPSAGLPTAMPFETADYVAADRWHRDNRATGALVRVTDDYAAMDGRLEVLEIADAGFDPARDLARWQVWRVGAGLLMDDCHTGDRHGPAGTLGELLDVVGDAIAAERQSAVDATPAELLPALPVLFRGG